MRAGITHPTRRSCSAERDATSLGCRGGSPAVVLAVAAVVISALIQLVPALARLAELDRGAVAAGQWWRVLSCHLAHWGWPHWAGDISALVGLWWLAENRIRWVLPMCLAAALAVSVTVLLGAGDVTSYRGMSGVNHALLVWVLLARAAETRGGLRIGCIVTLVGIAGKIAYEFTIDATAPAYSLPDEIALVAASHAAGAVVGLLGCGIYLAVTARTARRHKIRLAVERLRQPIGDSE